MATLKKFFVITVYGEGLPVAWQLQNEGVEVAAHILDDLSCTCVDGETPKEEEPEECDKRLALFDGMITKLSEEEMISAIKEADPETSFVLCDFNLTWPFADKVRDFGVPGLYPTEEDRKYETDREFAKQFVEKEYPDLAVAEVHEFKSCEEGIKFLETAKDSFVLKGLNEEARTIVPDIEDPELANQQLIKGLTEDGEVYDKGGFILEKRIEGAIELTPEAWFKDGELIGTSLDIELKRSFANEVGFMCGASADLVFPTDLQSRINEIAFPQAVYDMAKERGGLFIWDASLLFDPKDDVAYFGEFCPNRPGYNCLYSELSMFYEKRNFFEKLMDGENPFAGDHNFSASVRVFNFKPRDGKMVTPEDKAVAVLDDAKPYFFPMDVKKDEHEDEEMDTVGYDYQLGVVTGAGNSPKEAAKNCYINLEGVNFEEKVYRPLQDYISTKYPSSILNRFKYATQKGLI